MNSNKNKVSNSLVPTIAKRDSQQIARWLEAVSRAQAARGLQAMSSGMPGQGKSRSAKKRAAKRQNGSSGISSQAAPVSLGFRVSSQQPRVSRSARSMRIAHRELVIVQIVGATTFSVKNFLRLNPGLAATFPWLAPQAAQWEQYTCHRLIAEYIPIAPSSTQGDIILSPNYDASDPQPTTETQAGNNFGAVTDSCWKRVDLPLDPPAMMGLGPRKFVRASAVAGDVKTFDVGTLAVCVNNGSGAVAFGKLYLDYDFEFFIPQNDPSPSTSPLYTSQFVRHAAQTVTTATPVAMIFDTVAFDAQGIGAPVNGVFTPPAGAYQLQAQVSLTDSVNEGLQVDLEIFKNGAGLTVPVKARVVAAASAALETVQCNIGGLVTCNGTDTFQIELTATGAAGALTTLADTMSMTVRPA